MLFKNYYNSQMAQDSKRNVFAALSIIVFIIIVPYTLYRYVTTSQYINTPKPTYIRDRKFNDLTNGAMQAKINLSNNLFQVTFLVIAGLAGLFIAKRQEADFVLADVPEIIMFVCAGILLLLSFLFNILYLNEVSYIYSIAGNLVERGNISVPDIFDPNVNYLLNFQFVYFIFGVVISIFTFISAHRWKGGKLNEND
jgi:hypothetical protein